MSKQFVSKENLDIIHYLKMNNLIRMSIDGSGEYVPIDKLNETINFLRDYFIVLGKK